MELRYRNMETKSYNFSSVKLSDLKKIVRIQRGKDTIPPKKFQEWFSFEYSVSREETTYFDKLIRKHFYRLASYSEEKLKMRFLALILDQVDFTIDEQIQDWYDAQIQGEINGIQFKGFTDFMVASGEDEPQKPYFFIQEFKPSTPDKDPKNQLLAELLVAIEKNQTQVMRGGYIIGRNWYFVILEKIGKNAYEYFVSDQLDSLNLEHLTQIYICLQAVKLKYCQD